METETVETLLEKIDKQQYKEVIRYFSQHYKRLQIPGFSSLQNAPLKLIVNTAKTKKTFRKALLESISSAILAGETIDINGDISAQKSSLPKCQWLGLAALLLLQENEPCSSEAQKIIDEYDNDTHEAAKDTPSSTKEDKREEKFREKYLKLRKENEELHEEVKRHLELLRDSATEIEQLKSEKQALEQKCASYQVKLDELAEEVDQLKHKLASIQISEELPRSTSLPKMDIRILAPHCNDILGRFCDLLSLDFESNIKTFTTEELSEYNEIWAFPDVLPLSLSRLLHKLNQNDIGNIVFFQKASDLVAHAEKLTQSR